MLALDRKPGEAIYIGRDVRVTVSSVSRSGVVRLVVEAPKRVVISRDDFSFESHLRLQAEKDGAEAGL